MELMVAGKENLGRQEQRSKETNSKPTSQLPAALTSKNNSPLTAFSRSRPSTQRTGFVLLDILLNLHARSPRNRISALIDILVDAPAGQVSIVDEAHLFGLFSC